MAANIKSCASWLVWSLTHQALHNLKQSNRFFLADLAQFNEYREIKWD